MSKQKDKGRRAEHRVVKLHAEMGVPAKRVPLSGVLGGEFSDDIDLPYGKGEIKARKGAAGWKTIKAWLKDCDALFLLEDRTLPLVVLPWAQYAAMAQRLYACDTLQPEESTDGKVG